MHEIIAVCIDMACLLTVVLKYEKDANTFTKGMPWHLFCFIDCGKGSTLLRRKTCMHFSSHDEYDGDEMQNACQIDTDMPNGMKVFFLWFSIKEGTDRIHNTTADNQSKK